MDHNAVEMKLRDTSLVNSSTRTQRRRRQRQNRKLRAAKDLVSTDVRQPTEFLPNEEDQKFEREVRKRERRRKRRVRAHRVRDYDRLSTLASESTASTHVFVGVESQSYQYKEEIQWSTKIYMPFPTAGRSTNFPWEHDERMYLSQVMEETHWLDNYSEPSVDLWKYNVYGNNERVRKYNFITCSVVEEQQRRLLLEERQEQQRIHQLQENIWEINKHI